jgi:hypothetical protein
MKFSLQDTAVQIVFFKKGSQCFGVQSALPVNLQIGGQVSFLECKSPLLVLIAKGYALKGNFPWSGGDLERGGRLLRLAVASNDSAVCRVSFRIPGYGKILQRAGDARKIQRWNPVFPAEPVAGLGIKCTGQGEPAVPVGKQGMLEGAAEDLGLAQKDSAVRCQFQGVGAERENGVVKDHRFRQARVRPFNSLA